MGFPCVFLWAGRDADIQSGGQTWTLFEKRVHTPKNFYRTAEVSSGRLTWELFEKSHREPPKLGFARFGEPLSHTLKNFIAPLTYSQTDSCTGGASTCAAGKEKSARTSPGKGRESSRPLAADLMWGVEEV